MEKCWKQLLIIISHQGTDNFQLVGLIINFSGLFKNHFPPPPPSELWKIYAHIKN